MSDNSTVLATVISPDGEVDTVMLPSDNEPRLRQLQSLVGGYIETVALPNSRYMVFNENGKDAPHAINHTATAMAHEAEVIMPCDYVAGIAVIISEDEHQ